MSEIEWLIAKLYLCKGIGNSSIIKVWRLSQQLQRCPLKGEISHFVQPRSLSLFLEEWHYWHLERVQLFFANQCFYTLASPLYPELLRQIYDPPAVLFYHGNWSLLKAPLLGIVGARAATNYGKQVVAELLPDLVKEGYTIVSGMAMGIDTLSHWQAIKNQGKTIAVLGTGVDCCYPKEARILYERIGNQHLLLSEYPRGTPPKSYHFPARNRIIAGLSLGICVIEAKERSGSLITAQQALEYGREVLAVPGDILSKNSTGCHQLIQDGAKCVFSAQDILEEIHVF